MTTIDPSTISIRFAAERDRPSLVRLAALDSAPVPNGDVLLASVDGEPRAALSVHDGHVVADPFRPTADLVALLRARGSHLATRRDRRRSSVLRRLAARQAA
jgi:hypothetical protein